LWVFVQAMSVFLKQPYRSSLTTPTGVVTEKIRKGGDGVFHLIELHR
jgi:hypothetical protein